MTEQTWLTTDSPQAMLGYLSEVTESVYGQSAIKDRLPNHRKLRLLACACCRLMWHKLDYKSHRAVEVAERYADGLLDPNERGRAYNYVDNIRFVHEVIFVQTALSGNKNLCQAVLSLPGYFIDDERVGFAQAIRDVVGNPFCRMKIMGWATDNWAIPKKDFDNWISWNDSTVPAIARRIYNENAFHNMPILADALEDAGCTNTAILEHCRATQEDVICPECDGRNTIRVPGDKGDMNDELCPTCNPNQLDAMCGIPSGLHGKLPGTRHFKGCWVLDLLLGLK